ncbi:MAG: DnaJ domain-containing protein [Polyangiaceae bacterium]|nr:DnaJ domain-containing protein [Polyangiaceae bacterium]MCW5791558.1 DnaJ domain-containing protein [Polyangiaceae bacterium]
MTPPSDSQALLAHWNEILDDASYYELLGVLEIADDAAIKAAFHEFALAFHPDRHGGASEQELALVRRVFRRGAEAYRVLMDPPLRSKYDLALARGHVRLQDGELPQGPPLGMSHITTLEELCQRPAAKLHARRAEEHLTQGDLQAAKRELQLALYLDGANPGLEERIDAIDLALFAMGD